MTSKIVFKITMNLVLQTAYQESHLGKKALRDYIINLDALPLFDTYVRGRSLLKSVMKHIFEKLVQLSRVLATSSLWLLLVTSSCTWLHRPAQGQTMCSNTLKVPGLLPAWKGSLLYHLELERRNQMKKNKIKKRVLAHCEPDSKRYGATWVFITLGKWNKIFMHWHKRHWQINFPILELM